MTSPRSPRPIRTSRCSRSPNGPRQSGHCPRCGRGQVRAVGQVVPDGDSPRGAAVPGLSCRAQEGDGAMERRVTLAGVRAPGAGRSERAGPVNPGGGPASFGLDGQAHSGRQRPAGRTRRASVALCSGTIRLADPGRNAVTARHHGDGEGEEHEKEERHEQGDQVVPASLPLSLMRPQVCLTAHCVPFRNGKREGRATPGTRGHSRAAPRYHGAFPRAAAQSGTKRASGLIRPTRCHRGSGRRGAAAHRGDSTFSS